MSPSANLVIHPSQFPENVWRDLRESLRTRRVNHKFHYDSTKQTQKWLALHEAHSPARYDQDCREIYDRAFAGVAAQIKAECVHVAGLGCGGGQKDTQLLRRLRRHGRELFYTPCDVSAAMVLVARRAALRVISANRCFPFVCDLATADDLAVSLDSCITHHASRITTFFGMIPNFEPQRILPKLAALVRPKDYLLFSANLAPGTDYAAGLKTILPQYDNPLTRDWLMTFLLDLGVERGDGELRFSVETGAFRLRRVMARFHFRRTRRVDVGAETFTFRRGEAIQLFFSYRYTPDRVREILRRHGLEVREQWIAKSGEEGVFLCRHAS
jgi:L-histidine Nalpha-methyltransferase